MSLQINMDQITGVLMADGWHKCQGFSLDAYELGGYYPDTHYSSGWAFDCHHGGGQSGVCATGFVFTDPDSGVQIAGPLTAILALGGKGLCGSPPEPPGNGHQQHLSHQPQNG